MSLRELGASALADQRQARLIMWVAGLPAFAVPALIRRHPARNLWPNRLQGTEP